MCIRDRVKCYDKSRDGTSTGKWHDNCKDHGPILMLLQLNNGKHLGAYFPVGLSDTPTTDIWDNQNGASQKGWTTDSQAFLFATPPEGVGGVAKKQTVQNANYAMNQNRNCALGVVEPVA